MALQRDVIQLAFNQGIDTKTDPHILPLGKLHRLENARQKKIGSFAKKNGSTQKNQNCIALSGTPTFSGAKRLLKNGNMPLVIGDSFSIRDPVNDLILGYEKDVDKWSYKSNVSSIFSFSEPYYFGKANAGYANPQFYDTCKINDDYLAVAYVADLGGGLSLAWFSVVDIQTGSNIFVQGFSALAGSSPRVISFLGKIYFLLQDTAGRIYAYEYDITTNPGGFIGSGQVVVNDAFNAIGGYFDCTVDATNSVFYLAYNNNTPNLALKSYTALTSGTPANPLTATNTTILAETLVAQSPIAIGVNPTSARVHVQWNVLAGMRLWIGNLSLTVVAAAATITTKCWAFFILPELGTSNTHIVSTDGGGATIQRIYNAAGLVDTETVASNAYLASRGAFYNGTLFFHLQSPNVNQIGIFLASTKYNASDAVLYRDFVSRALYGSGYFSTNTYIPLPSVSNIGADLFCIFNQVLDELSAANLSISAKILRHEISPHNAYQGVELAGCTYFAGGNITKFDGFSALPAQGRLYPQIDAVTAKVGAAILTPTGVYSFVVVGVKIDAQGNITKSAPSEPVSKTLVGAENNVDITFEALLAFDYDALYIYRTINAGTNYFFDGIVLSTASTFSPVYTDTLIVANEQLYTDGGDLFNICPPPAYALAVWQDRLWALTDEKIRYSKKTYQGRAAEFADELVLDIETGGGRPTALAALNDKLLIFKNSKIYYTTGDGPNDQGLQGTFLPPREITSLYGALNQRTVLSLGSEVWFQSSKGYFRIDSSFAISEVGLPLDYFLSKTPIKSIEYIEEDSEVRISDGTRTYVFNTITQQWGTMAWADNDQKLIGDDYWRINSGADILTEDESTTADDGANVTMSLTTGWIVPGTIQGLQRVYSLIILARMFTEVPLKVDVFYDYVPDVFETFTLNPTTPSTKDFAAYSDADLYVSDSYSPGTRKYPYQWQIRPSYQKCEAIRFTISDVPSNGNDSFELVALALEVGLKKRIFTGRDVVKA